MYRYIFYVYMFDIHGVCMCHISFGRPWIHSFPSQPPGSHSFRQCFERHVEARHVASLLGALRGSAGSVASKECDLVIENGFPKTHMLHGACILTYMRSIFHRWSFFFFKKNVYLRNGCFFCSVETVSFEWMRKGVLAWIGNYHLKEGAKHGELPIINDAWMGFNQYK